MISFRLVRLKLRALFAKRQVEQELDEELQFHIDQQTALNVRAGLEPAEARRRALVAFGGVERFKEATRDSRGTGPLEDTLHDTRYALRGWLRNPGFTVAVLSILAIGIGANTSLFSTIHAVLLRAVPFRDPGRLVAATKTYDGVPSGSVSRVDYFDYREEGRSFEHLAAIANFTIERIVTGGDRPTLVQEAYITWNLLPMLGVHPVVGRGFTAEEEAGGRGDLILISHAYWQTRFGGAPQVVGSTLTMGGSPSTVVGVLPAGFRILFEADVWRLVDRDGPFDGTRDSHSYVLIGRLGPGVTLEQAREETAGISRALAEQYPETNTSKGLWVTSLQSYMVRSVRTSLLVLTAVTLLVLVIASANVAGLLLARSERRRDEMAMRSALGASRSRLVRQMLTESLLLTVTAGVLGLGVAHLFQRALVAALPMGELGIDLPGLNALALGVAVAVAVGSGLIVGLTPALHGTNQQTARQLRSGMHATGGTSGTRLRSGFVVLQVALTVVLLVGSGLFLQSLTRLTRADLGFDAHDVLTGEVLIDGAVHPTGEARGQFFATLLEDVNAIPGVTAAGLINRLPIKNPWQDWGAWPSDRPPPPPEETFSPLARWVSPGYFSAMGIPLLAGRDISRTDAFGEPYVAVLSESSARRLFPDRDPIGQLFKIAWEDRDFRVVGIVADARLNAVGQGPDPAVYMSAAQLGATRLQLAVRTRLSPNRFVGPIDDGLQRLDPNALFARPVSMESVLARELASFRIMTVSSTAFAVVALLLATIGVYGVMSYHVGQRLREFGIRLAMGASDARLVLLVIRRGVSLVFGGVLVGVAAAYPLSLLVRQVLYDTAPLDLVAYGVSVLLLVLVATFACMLPASRATRVGIADVLRLE